MRTTGVLGVTVGAALYLAGGCSLTSVERRECLEDTECAAAFGVGFACGDDGFCEATDATCRDVAECRDRSGFGVTCSAGICLPLSLTARCDRTFPDGLLERSDLAEYVVFGSLMDRSVPSQVARERSIRLAPALANERGGLGGRPFGVIFCNVAPDVGIDERSREEAAVASAEWLVNVAGVPAIVGPSASGDTAAVFERLRGTGTLVISPSATSPALTGLDLTSPTDEVPGLLWRTAPPDSLQGRRIAEDMQVRAVADIGVINEVGPYGDELARVFEEEIEQTLTAAKFTEPGAIGDRAVSVGEAGVEEVLFVSSQTSDVVAFLDAAAALSTYDGVSIFLTDSAAASEVFELADPTRFSQVRGTRPLVVQDSVFSAFVATYSATYGEDVTPFSFTAQAYDAAWLTLYGIAWADARTGTIDGLGIAQGLRQTSEGDAVEVGPSQWQGVQQAFREGKSIDVRGASGDLDYDLVTEETTAPVEVWRIVDDCEGGFEIEGIELGATPAPKICP